MTLATGQTLSFYEILGPLGAGAMGEVYRARDTRLDREVALKVLPDEMAQDQERLQRFEREARTLASLNHSNVAQVFGIDEVDGTCFMAMELVPGEDLAARLSHGALQLTGALDVCRQIAEGLEAAHEAGVIHRDLKPANVLVTPEGKVKVLDFGLAKHSGTDGRASSTTDSALTTEEGRVLGTPTYMAPEQARGKPVDKRVDIWAFGCVLFECLTGQRAFAGETVGEVLATVLEKEPDWSSLPETTPEPLRQLLVRCLCKDPLRRMRDIGEARISLEDQAAASRDPKPPADGAPPRRTKLVSFGLAVVLLATASILLVEWRGADDGADTPYSSTPLTFSQYYDRDPTWSPGGEWIAFSRLKSGSIDLWLKNISSGEEFAQRKGPGDEASPRWSPDGRYIAVLCSDLPGTPVVLVRPHSSGAGGERVLVDTNVRVLDILSQWRVMGCRPWRDDGSSLLVSRVTEGGQSAVFRKSVDKDLLEQLTVPPVGSNDYYASYSFDQQRIVFVRITQGNGTLMMMSAEGGTAEVLFDRSGLIGLASWRPDDQSIVFIDQVGVWEVDVDTRTARRLLFTPDQSAHHGELAVCADGRIAYSVGVHDTTLTSLELETGERTRLTNHFGTNFYLCYSSRGEIAYNSDRTGDAEIWVLAPDGEELRLTYEAGIDNAPDWSADGERLIFRSNRDGAFKTYMMNRDGGDCRLVWNRAISDGWMAPRWSPSSPNSGELIGCIVPEEGGNALWGVQPDGENERRLLDGVVDFDWYLDSRRVICTLDEGRAEQLVAVNLETGDVQELWKGPHDELEVSPDGRFVLFGKGLGHASMGRAMLELEPPEESDGLPRAIGEPIDLVRPDGPWHTHHGSWAPDMKSIVYVHDADRANIYELIEQP
jgi:serine/threonine protein kinase